MKIDHCRSCHAPVIWSVTAKGKRMPVDAEPVATGNIKLFVNGSGIVYSSKPGPSETEERYLPHFATCPQVGSWRPKARH